MCIRDSHPHERDQRLDQPFQRQLGHRASGKKIHPERRRDHAQRQVDHHDDAEMHRVQPELQRHRQQPVSYTHLDVYKRQLPHLFQRFYRVDAARGGDGVEHSHGLGLAIVKAVAVMHGGTVSALSLIHI